ncbi:MAG: cupin domain-containing protein [Woeseiaceae bacterium]|nr:cupin domain-containing protein [Woeseiaceae bacterium]
MNQRQERPGVQERTVILTVGFLVWSALMIMVGSIWTEAGISESHAATGSTLVRLDRNRLDGNDLGEYEPYDPDAGDLIARGYEFYYSDDGNFGIGVWESMPGKTTYTDLTYDELMYVLEGEMVMTDSSGNTDSVGPGEGLVLPAGWSGTLSVLEGGVRKIWVTYMGDKK